MKGFTFGQRSMTLLLDVHSDLRALALLALLKSEVDFAVVQGNRTLDMQKRLYGQGRTPKQCTAAGVPTEYSDLSLPIVTWTLKSDHIGGKAIDVCPYVNGKYDWDNEGKRGHWPKVHAAFKAAAAELGLFVDWGGNWSGTKKDRPHFALK